MKNISIIRQTTNTECGICCVAMVGTFYKYYQPISYYRNKFNIGRDGTSMKDLYKILTEIGFDVTAYEIRNINEFEFENIPYILYLKDNHFVVLKKITSKYAILLDPAKGKVKITIDELKNIFGGYALTTKTSERFMPNKKRSNDFKHVIKIMSNVKLRLFEAVVISSIVYIVSLYVPITLKEIIDSIVSDVSIYLPSILLKICILIGLYSLLSMISNKVNIKLQTELYENLKLQTVSHLFKIPYSFFDNRSQGNILFRMDLLSQVQDVVSNSFIQIIMSFTCIMVIICYFTLSFIQLIPIILISILLIGIYVLLVGKYLLKMQTKELEKSELVDSTQTEIITNMFQIKCLHLENYFWTNFKLKFNNFKLLFVRNRSVHALLNLILGLFNTFLPIILLLFIINLKNNAISVGQMFLIYSLLSSLLNYSNSFFNEITSITMLKASLHYLNDMLDEPEIVCKNSEKIDSFKSIKIQHVSFKYNDIANLVIQDINIDALRGDKVGIVGISGSGKTTLVKLLANLYKPTQGIILINGIDTKKISSETYNNIISIVPQVPIVFNKTIKNNITLDDSNISDNQVEYALKLANFWDEVKAMPLGINTFISGQGGNLSGGQIQRLALARALVRSPQLVILDEATSSLDSRNESIIYENLRKQNITTIIISHRLATISDSDMTYVIDNGRIIESGNHLELIKNKSVYYELFSQQVEFKDKEEENVKDICVCGES